MLFLFIVIPRNVCFAVWAQCIWPITIIKPKERPFRSKYGPIDVFNLQCKFTCQPSNLHFAVWSHNIYLIDVFLVTMSELGFNIS